MPHHPSTPADDTRRLAERVLALEESHTFLARTLEVLSSEIHGVGTALHDLARRVDRFEERLNGPGAHGDAPGIDEE